VEFYNVDAIKMQWQRHVMLKICYYAPIDKNLPFFEIKSVFFWPWQYLKLVWFVNFAHSIL